MTERRPKIAIVVFPGSNDDWDAALAFEALGAEPALVWHGELERMCEQLLANPLIESYEITVAP